MSFRREASAQGQAARLPDSDQVGTLGFGSHMGVCSTCEVCSVGTFWTLTPILTASVFAALHPLAVWGFWPSCSAAIGICVFISCFLLL